MRKNWSSGADRLADTARAAGFAMATPDDQPDDDFNQTRSAAVVPVPAPGRPQRPVWSASSPTRALVVAAPATTSYQTLFRDWMASLTWRAPA
jgi:hypothetical protein